MSGRPQRVVLTGGAGFIGSHVAEALLRRGDNLTIVDNLHEFYSPDCKRQNLEDIRDTGNFDFCRVDICDKQSLREVLSRSRPELIIHLASRAGVRPSIEEPSGYADVNINGTLNLFGITVICLRFLTVSGQRQRPDLAIYKFTLLIEAGKPVPIFGNGSSGRDYTYIGDIVAGVLAATEYELPSRHGAVPFEVFNLGNSHPVKLSELVELLEQITHKKAMRQQRPLQPGDVPLTWADISKAGRLLGYRPATRLEEGLEQFVAWYRMVSPSRWA